MLNIMYKITNQASRNPIKILLQKKLETKDEELDFFILFLPHLKKKMLEWFQTEGIMMVGQRRKQ